MACHKRWEEALIIQGQEISGADLQERGAGYPSKWAKRWPPPDGETNKISKINSWNIKLTGLHEMFWWSLIWNIWFVTFLGTSLHIMAFCLSIGVTAYIFINSGNSYQSYTYLKIEYTCILLKIQIWITQRAWWVINAIFLGSEATKSTITSKNIQQTQRWLFKQAKRWPPPDLETNQISKIISNLKHTWLTRYVFGKLAVSLCACWM